MEHAAKCFGRLVCVLLGSGSVADGKMEWGQCLCILGVQLRLGWNGFVCRPAPVKVKAWCALLDKYLLEDKLNPGEAAKLAGRLSWGCSQLFKCFGRAFLRPIFDQSTRRDGRMSNDLRRALQWWRQVLALEIAERHEWVSEPVKPVHLFCDASGSPPHLGAALFVDDAVYWTHSGVEASLLESFRARRDNQIMGLELLAISLGMSTFERFLAGRDVIVHCDNSGAEVRFLARSAAVPFRLV